MQLHDLCRAATQYNNIYHPGVTLVTYHQAVSHTFYIAPDTQQRLDSCVGKCSDMRRLEGPHGRQLKIRSPSKWAVSARDSDGGSGLSQDVSRDVDSLLGATVRLPDRL